MKSIFKLSIVIFLAGCAGSNSNQQETPSKTDTPLYTISDLAKSGYKGNIRKVIYKNYEEVEMVNNQWVPARGNKFAGKVKIEYYDNRGFLTAIHTEGYDENVVSPIISDDSFHYANGILTHKEHYIEFLDENGDVFMPREKGISTIYYWLSQNSYKIKKFMCKDNVCDSVRYLSLQYEFNKDYRLEKEIEYSMEDTNKTDRTKLLTYDKDYNTTSFSTPGGSVHTTETILQRDKDNNPSQIIYKDPENKYQYKITYEYY